MANYSTTGVKFPMSKAAKSQQQKFFRICSDDYKNKLTGKTRMSLADYNDITLILCILHFDDYYSYVLCRFSDLFDFNPFIENYLDDLFDLETYAAITDELIEKFCNGIKSKRLKPLYEEMLLPHYA